ncbi:biopolymer transporter ExbD [Fontisphaera persica]|uniref:ExbD/TolR family protein n=1 Tax=Fontisphaera persica TaxID=2974023 RepID=UPI0024BF2789|nr:biopolymer transporter ExbD [Fontisphaera persica]WCJ59815.1 biopolymer transporter ExbD [Fontisphaera persica]
MRIHLDDENEPGVLMSPLIDCVFLLLIFFLVTTMLRKWERQIPVKLPSATASLSSTKSMPETEIIAMGTDKKLFAVVSHDAYSGQTTYLPINNLPAYLAALRARRGADVPLEIAAERGVSVQTVIDVFDMCQLQGFKQTRVRLGGKPSADQTSE